MKNDANLLEARRRIAACLMLDGQGNLVQRQDHLNLAGLGLTTEELVQAFDPQERGLPSISLADLVHLRYLDLTGNELDELPRCVCAMTGLVWLGLNFNQLTALPEEINQLANLKRLYVRGNRLATLPDTIGDLRGLVELDLNGNILEDLPGGFAELLEGRPKSDLHIDFGGNAADFLRLFKTDDPAAFLAELKAQQKARRMIREGKLLLVGEGEVGKSTLLRALRGKPFLGGNVLKQTQGVEMAPLPLPLGAMEPEVTLNAWDFSGQDPVRDTHQIFFTKPAIYLLVFKARTGTNVQTLIDWLWLIKHRTRSHAKVLIVGTEVGAGRAQVDDLDRVWRVFGGPEGLLIEEKIYYVECNEKHAGGQIGIPELRDRLLDIVNVTAGFCQVVSQDMLNVRKKVDVARANQKHFMDWQTFEDLCYANGKGLQRQHVPAFARQQHEIGKLVWIDRGILAQTVILAPDWLGKALAYIFQPRQDGTEASLGGIATQRQIDGEWQMPRRFGTEGHVEPPLDKTMYPIFRAFMAEFDLWHPVDQESRGDERRYLIPKLFAADRRAWDAAWEALPPEKGRLQRQVQLNGWDGAPLNTWLMRAFFSRLIVRLYPQLYATGSADAETHWRHGFRLEEMYLGRARVWFEKDRGRIHFDSAGNKPDALWYSLRSTIDGLCHEMAEPGTEMEIMVEKFVPCTAAVECHREPLAAFAEADVLRWLNDTELGPKIPCVEKGCPHKLSIQKLAEGIEAARGPTSSRDDEAHAKLDALLITGGRIENSLAAFWQSLDARFNSMRHTLEAIQNGVEATEHQLATVSLVVAEVKGELIHVISWLDDPNRLGPCLYYLEPQEPDFWKDPGKLFGTKFRLQLCCERTLLPVNWFRSTPRLGNFTFTMNEEWWAVSKPYLKGITKLLAAFVPGAGLLGHSGEIQALVRLSNADILKCGKDLLENTEKLLELPDAPEVSGSRIRSERRKAPYGQPNITEARGIDLKQLHTFLLSATNQPSLETANLGLLRRYDKGQRRHLWVHESQVGYYDEPREP